MWSNRNGGSGDTNATWNNSTSDHASDEAALPTRRQQVAERAHRPHLGHGRSIEPRSATARPASIRKGWGNSHERIDRPTVYEPRLADLHGHLPHAQEDRRRWRLRLGSGVGPERLALTALPRSDRVDERQEQPRVSHADTARRAEAGRS